MSTAPVIPIWALPDDLVDGPFQSDTPSKIPIWKRALYFIELWAIKIFVSTALALKPVLEPASKATRPTFTKTYPCRPHLKNHIFIPTSHKAGQVLPLYINVHGGGFVLSSPIADDEFCFQWANQFNILVVSINYSKAPTFKFPVPTHDVAAISLAVINDDTLPIDRTRVAIGGFSAGGNLALSAVQLPALKGKIKAVIPWYPVVDLSLSLQFKEKMRPYKKEGDIDGLARVAPLFDYGYIPRGQDLRDPLLSPRYADRSDLPEYIYTIAAEYDLLAYEAWAMMCRLAGINKPNDAERYSFERGKYRWTLVRDVHHGYTHPQLGATEDEKKRLIEVSNKSYAEAGQWLLLEVFAK